MEELDGIIAVPIWESFNYVEAMWRPSLALKANYVEIIEQNPDERDLIIEAERRIIELTERYPRHPN
jgi:hypothetical protein